MKKLFAMLLALTVLLSMAACGGGTPNTSETDPVSSNTPDTQPTEAETGETTVQEENIQTVPEEWGSRDRFSTRCDGGVTDFYMHFPVIGGYTAATAMSVANQMDGTYVILDGQLMGISPEVDSVVEVFPAYFEQTIRIFENDYGSGYSDGDFMIDNSKMLEINGYEMCKVVGTHTFKYQQEACSRKFVAYATQLKDNGAYIYWLVQDETDDQSMFETLEAHAYNMALTLEEIED